MEQNTNDFPARLQRLREGRRMNRLALSECCGVSKNMIARYERGEVVPQMDNAARIAEFFGVSLDFLWYGKNF